ncbi:hypothetical protein RB2654_04746 [Maritimibacter alkaliphilus HTCC2654]|uniref:Uncharacterized protein n=1 Tax=Maritimibacter alkaliphilus HTCC2654 TaxID=314271 RepID=A3VKI4_9RHOB|nr:hypothetical protein RB2654_04746 [Maritimibacter alkaliphilus HTCC2654]
MARHAEFKVFDLGGGRQVAVEQQEADFEVMRFLGQLVDRVTPVQKLTLFAIDEGDRAFAAPVEYSRDRSEDAACA